MILVDTSVWIEHFRRGNAVLAALLAQKRIAIHPFVVGEVALGGAAPATIERLSELKSTVRASDEEVLDLITRHKLVGRRIGYLDAHLLASALVTGNTQIWTLDKSMRSVAADVGIAVNPFQLSLR